MPNVLVSLLSGKFQLWAALNEQRETYGFIITCVSQDTLTKEEYLIIEMVYGFRKSNDEIVFETWECLKEFALAQGCEYIKANTNVARAAELLERVGFVETSRTFIARIK
jgi:hypothetical protein